MKSANRTILIAGMGTSPAVLTETVWALAHQAEELMYDNYSNLGSGLLRN
jgi:CRISPR-associated protein (TIGR02584 family)